MDEEAPSKKKADQDEKEEAEAAQDHAPTAEEKPTRAPDDNM